MLEKADRIYMISCRIKHKIHRHGTIEANISENEAQKEYNNFNAVARNDEAGSSRGTYHT